MTDTTTSTATTAATAADSGATTDSTTTNSQATEQAAETTEPSSSQSAPVQDAPKDEKGASTDSEKTDDPQDQSETDADDSAKEDQPSKDENADDSDEDKEAKDKEEGNQEAEIPKYEAFNLPEGIALDEDALNEALPVLGKLKATQEDAQAMVDIASNMISKVMKNVSEQHNKVVDGWRSESESLFGKDGDAKFQERLGRAEEVVKQFFNEEQREVLTAYGLGNHPAFFAMALAIAEGTQEDRQTLPSSSNALQSPQTLGETWYPAT